MTGKRESEALVGLIGDWVYFFPSAVCCFFLKALKNRGIIVL